MDDDELIASLAGGDDAALRELFTRPAPWLAARLRAVLRAPDVEDVLQETFLAVWQNAQIPLIIETGAAAAIAVISHGPFGEPERATGGWLPYLRLGTALALTGLAIAMLQLAVTGASLKGEFSRWPGTSSA